MRLPVLCAILAALPVSAADSAKPLFYKDILPVLQRHCQSCHRPGEAAPMSFMTYESTRPWAKAIRQAVNSGKMPPWGADPHVGAFSNSPTITSAQIALLSKWAETGAAAGNPKDAPAPVAFTEGWQMGQPDAVFEMPVSYDIPPNGTLEYTYFVIPTGFKEDRWVQLSECRPGNRAVVHHMIAFIREPGSRWMAGATPGAPFIPAGRRGSGGEGSDGMADEYLAGYAPGTPPMRLHPGQARLVKAGSDIVLQMHYTTNGKAASDRSKVGFIFAREPVRERVSMAASSSSNFKIPPGDPSFRVDGVITTKSPLKLLNMQPHMHLRGKSFEYRAVFPDGRVQTLLRVPRYDFNWQHIYEPAQPVELTPGTRIEATAIFDNSANNPFNPDPKAEVRWGDQSWEEMMIGFFDVAFDPALDKKDLFVRPQSKKASSSHSE